ncbi:DoxX family protein [Flavobacterium aurantiibacter]|uniref:DoxX family protein n=1 Tax=Flavobacterium aurantiibacter TaxID=2023067 RepID=A0A256A083_9FLAO|nr:DoxX family protein [Flavobacterium aurantiibacter]OYQ47168.1 DoxX family protein [Flavobacterium aurantiibacter]
MKKIFFSITKPSILPQLWQDVLLSLPRILCGYWMAVDFGAVKFGLPWSPPENNLGFFEVAFWFPNNVAEFGGIFAVFPAFFAWMAAFSEAVGGIALVLGFQTRIFSLLAGCTMFVAAVYQQSSQGLWNMLPALGILWVCLSGMALGSTRIGIDFLITKKRSQ